MIMWLLNAQVLEKVESAHNGEIQVVRTLEGVRITVGGISQSGWLVRRVWQPALAKIKKMLPDAGRILILGLGGGSVAQLTEHYWPDSKKIGVDVDPVMVYLGEKYLNLGDVGNLKFEEADAFSWVETSKKKFDLVLVDLYKGDAIPAEFRTVGFFSSVAKLVAPAGVAAFNHLYSAGEREMAAEFEKRLHKVFSGTVTIAPEANIIYICCP